MVSCFVRPSTYELPLVVAGRVMRFRPHKIVLRAVRALDAGTVIAAVPVAAMLRLHDLPDEAQSRYTAAAADIAHVLRLDVAAERHHAALTVHVATALCGTDDGVPAERWLRALARCTDECHALAGPSEGERHVVLGNERVVADLVERMRSELLTHLPFGVVPTAAALSRAWRLVSSCAVELQPPAKADATHLPEASAGPPAALVVAPVLASVVHVATTQGPNVALAHAECTDVRKGLSLRTSDGAFTDGGRQSLRCHNSDGYVVLTLSRAVAKDEVLCLSGAQVPLPIRSIDDVQFLLGVR